MQNGACTACDFILTVTGVVTSNYGNNENLTLTLCSQNDGDAMTINFSEFSMLFEADFLSIYDGASALIPQISKYSGTGSPRYVLVDYIQ
ncbi:MAG: hypothetical protein ACJARX_000776 [Psychroserpens sp.]|jgi:hypothetical protein|uniref:hypothetical protein n=1 Tax=Psychroserpens sp. TaxID=2020870 RepID=UPI0039E3BAC8